MDEFIKSDGPNRDEIDYWNGPQGQNWTEQNRLTDLMYDPFRARALEQADLQVGETVLDVGCGCGTTTLKIANSVVPGGSVTAVDVSAPMLEVAREQTKSASVPVDILQADAEIYPFEPTTYDAVFSQFGVMFFANPDAAFANFWRALKPDGRLAFVCWRSAELNPWLTIPLAAVHHFMPEMPTPSPDTPASPLSFESRSKVEALLTGAGFTDVQLDNLETTARMGQGSLDDCAKFVAAINGPVSGIMRKVGEVKADAVMEALTKRLSKYHNADRLEFQASAWIVSAQKR